MKTRFASKAAATAALALAAGVGAQNCADQRAPECTTGFIVTPSPITGLRAGYPTRFELLGQSGACNEGEILKGGLFGVRTYYQGGSDGLIDYDIPAKVALQFEDVGQAAFTANDHNETFDRLDPNLVLYNLGQFATPTPDGDRCDVVGIAPIDVSIPASEPDPGDPEDEEDDFAGAPAVRYRVEWSRLQFLVTTGYPGTQFEGEVTIQVNDCVGTYKATGVYATSRITCDDEAGNPSQALCNPVPDVESQIFEGTGINPDFPVRCDPDTRLCVLDGDFPAFR